MIKLYGFEDEFDRLTEAAFVRLADKRANNPLLCGKLDTGWALYDRDEWNKAGTAAFEADENRNVLYLGRPNGEKLPDDVAEIM